MPRRRGDSSYARYVQYLLETGRPADERLPKLPKEVSRGVVVSREQALREKRLLSLYKQEQSAQDATDAAILKHKLGLIAEQQKHEHRVSEDILDEEQKYKFELFERGLDVEKDVADLESKRAQTRLRDAQRQKIISEPARAAWEKMMESLENRRKEGGKADLEVLKTQGNVALETFKQQNRERLTRLKASLKPPKLPKETPDQILSRLMATGAVSTVGDVAQFWFGQKRKKEDVELLTKMQMKAAGIPYEEIFEEEAQFFRGEKEDVAAAWKRLFTVPIGIQPKSMEVSNTLRQQFPDRYAAERMLKQSIARARQAGEAEDIWRTDEAEMLRAIEMSYPGETSVYHQLLEPFEPKEPTFRETLGVIKQDIKNLFSRSSPGMKMSPEQETELEKQFRAFGQQVIEGHERAQEAVGEPRLEFIQRRARGR